MIVAIFQNDAIACLHFRPFVIQLFKSGSRQRGRIYRVVGREVFPIDCTIYPTISNTKKFQKCVLIIFRVYLILFQTEFQRQTRNYVVCGSKIVVFTKELECKQVVVQ
jgi:hypothetical protein